MSEIKKSLNPCIFHLQKLRLELNCPLCLNLMNRPMLLPCNHIFCNFCVPKSCQFSTNCPACQQQFSDQDVRPASYMENIVAIFKSLESTFNSAILPFISTDPGSAVSNSMELGETALETKNNRIVDLQIDCVPSEMQLTRCSASELLDVNHAPEMSPDCSLSSVDTKVAEGHNSNAGGRNWGAENNRVKNSVGDHLGMLADRVNVKDSSHTRETKRQKKLHYGSSDAVPQTHACSQQIGSCSDPAVSIYDECKPKEDTSIISSTGPRDADVPCVNGSACAFCHSSKITEGTGELVHYANGKEVIRGDAAFTMAVPVHRKCIEWTPQVYFEGDIIKNLDSELARASKLKCSSCGLKGAALGCFAKSCRRSYHVPCAVEIPECRWDCEAFVMLCPTHKSIKFPSEKFNSKKRHSGEKCSTASQITPEQLKFWATSPSGPQEWVLCGSALSSEEKCLVAKLAKVCGATVYKLWNPDVTHVIAATDSNGACGRTLKVLMAILTGKWILSIDWVKACVEANCLVNEEPYEVNLDNHGCRDGPRKGRLRASTNGPKLFDCLSFYFNGDFVLSYKRDLLDLVRVGGGSIVETVAEGESLQAMKSAFVVYNHDYPQGCMAKEATSLMLKRLAEAKDVANRIDAQVIPHTWILESIAACRVLPHPGY